MFYHLALAFKHYASFLNVVHYTNFRMMSALLTGLFLFFLTGAWFIRRSQEWFKSKAREYTPESHRAKDGIPTMGGLLILVVVFVTGFLWCRLDVPEVWLFFACMLGYGAIGFWDDIKKIRSHKGIPENQKFLAQIFVGFLIVGLWLWISEPSTTLCIPFFKNLAPELGWFFIPWCVFLLVATSNAVNLSDGLDGLAISSLISNFATFTVFLYITGNTLATWYLRLPFTGNAEIAVLGAALVGASIGFLWYNTYPAQIFMGDIGSLSLGAALAFMALLSKQELLLPLAGGIFVLATVSVILQVLSYKLRGKRIFRMAPIHHHFELLGWHESKITVRFTIISLVLCILALMTLKLR